MRLRHLTVTVVAITLLFGTTVAQASFLDKLKDAAKEATSGHPAAAAAYPALLHRSASRRSLRASKRHSVSGLSG